MPFETRFDARYAELLRHAGDLPDDADPLRAELAVSRLLGSAWSLAAAGEHRAIRRGLVSYLGNHPGRPALALLRAAAALGSSVERAAAERAADVMAWSGVAEPAWLCPAGQVTPGRCWMYGDVFGDQESVVACFDYAPAGGPERSTDPADRSAPVRGHALVVLVDHNLGGIVKDMFCAVRADRALAAIRRATDADGPMSVFAEITAGQARTRLERAFAACRETWEPPVGQQARSLWALADARLVRLPDGPPPSGPDQYDEVARAGLVREFLASAPARALPDRQAAAECARLIVDHGCDYDGGNPLRISPAKTELFLLYWLPRQSGLDGGIPVADRPALAAMPATFTAWVRWAASGQGMSGQPLAEVLAAVQDCLARFTVEGPDRPAGPAPDAGGPAGD